MGVCVYLCVLFSNLLEMKRFITYRMKSTCELFKAKNLAAEWRVFVPRSPDAA